MVNYETRCFDGLENGVEAKIDVWLNEGYKRGRGVSNALIEGYVAVGTRTIVITISYMIHG